MAISESIEVGLEIIRIQRGKSLSSRAVKALRSVKGKPPELSAMVCLAAVYAARDKAESTEVLNKLSRAIVL